MKAVWFTRQGPAAEVLQFGEQPTPHAGPGEVRVRLHASGVNPADIVRWLQEGGMMHAVSSVHALPRAADAHLAVESGKKRGTVVVDCTALEI